MGANGSGMSNVINTTATAESIPTSASVLAPIFCVLFSAVFVCVLMFFRSFKIHQYFDKERKPSGLCAKTKTDPGSKNPGSLSCLFAHTSSFIQTLLLVPEFLICRSPVQPSSTLSRKQVADFTASWDLHPTPKIYFLSAPHYSAFWHAIQVISVNLIIFCSYSRFYRI